MPFPDQNHVQCTARAKGSGERCKNPTLVGLPTCRIHGSGTKAAKRKSAVAKVERRMEAFVKPLPPDHPLANPAAGLMGEYLRTQGRIEWLHKQISKLEEEHLTWGKTKEEQVNASETPGTNTTWEGVLHPYLVLEERERTHLLQIEKLLASNEFRAAEFALNHRIADELQRRVFDIVRAVHRDPEDPRVKRALAKLYGPPREIQAARRT
jgi:hypothetical protein